MHDIQVDVIGIQAAQTVVDTLPDPLGARVFLKQFLCIARSVFGRQEHIITDAQLLDRPTKILFASPILIGHGGIKEIDTVIVGITDDLLGLVKRNGPGVHAAA